MPRELLSIQDNCHNKSYMITEKYYVTPLSFALHAIHSDLNLSCGFITYETPLITSTSENNIDPLTHCIRKQEGTDRKQNLLSIVILTTGSSLHPGCKIGPQ